MLPAKCASFYSFDTVEVVLDEPNIIFSEAISYDLTQFTIDLEDEAFAGTSVSFTVSAGINALGYSDKQA